MYYSLIAKGKMKLRLSNVILRISYHNCDIYNCILHQPWADYNNRVSYSCTETIHRSKHQSIQQTKVNWYREKRVLNIILRIFICHIDLCLFREKSLREYTCVYMDRIWHGINTAHWASRLMLFSIPRDLISYVTSSSRDKKICRIKWLTIWRSQWVDTRYSSRSSAERPDLSKEFRRFRRIPESRKIWVRQLGSVTASANLSKRKTSRLPRIAVYISLWPERCARNSVVKTTKVVMFWSLHL